MAKSLSLIHYDRLYGQTQVDSKDLAIYQTPQFARLNDISLSAVPSWAQPTGTCASRAEHSRGVRFLAKILAGKKTFRSHANDLILAATLHDIGSPPFSHVTEPLQMAITGLDHEAFSKHLILNTDLAKVIKKQGGHLDNILKLIQGDLLPLSDLVNGTIDLDNLDNTLRFGSSMGLIDASQYYDPRQIVAAFLWEQKQTISIDGKYFPAVKSWELCRHQVYRYVNSFENLSPGAMITRALEFAHREGELKSSFFTKTDHEALAYLQGCNPQTVKLIGSAYHWQFYPQAFAKNIELNAKRKADLYSYHLKGQDLADHISSSLKIASESVCALIAYDKGFKQIHLPIKGLKKTFHHAPVQTPKLLVRVYIHPQVKYSAKTVAKITTQKLEQLQLTAD